MRGRERVREALSALKERRVLGPREQEIEVLILVRGAKNAVERNRIRRRVRAGIREIISREKITSAVFIIRAPKRYFALPWADLIRELERQWRGR